MSLFELVRHDIGPVGPVCRGMPLSQNSAE